MDYITGIKFQTSLINIEEEKELTTSNQLVKNQQKRCRCSSINHLQVTSKDCPMGLASRKAKKLALGIGQYQFEANKAEEDAAAYEESKCMAERASGEDERSD